MINMWCPQGHEKPIPDKWIEDREGKLDYCVKCNRWYDYNYWSIAVTKPEVLRRNLRRGKSDG